MSYIPKTELDSIKNRKIPGTNEYIDLFLVQQFLKRVILPFDKWPAYQLGIIDDKGKVLRQRSSLKTREERQAWGYYDIVVANLKKILAKVPGGGSKLVSIAAAYFLFKEHKNFDCTNELLLQEHFVKKWKAITEEVAANMTGPSIAGTEPQNPTVPVRNVPDPKRKTPVLQLLRRKLPR